MLKTVLVTGGAGYIGSHTTHALTTAGYHVIVLDDFSQHQTTELPWATIIRGDFADTSLLHNIFSNYAIDAVFHFAAFIEVGESVKRPRDFYTNNVTKTAILIDTMLDHNVHSFIFSSSCAVYGEPQYVPMDEKHPTAPVSPYGRTKLAVEFMLQDYALAYGLRYASLRYFNASGTQWELNLSEQHTPETHLIPLLLKAITNGKPVNIFGDTYPTADGTCVRDYIHVRDLATAHLLAYQYITKNNATLILNIGTGHGYSVKEVIKMAEKISGLPARSKIMPPRLGDAPMLVANTNRMRNILRWQPEHSDLETILLSAYTKHRQDLHKEAILPNGL